VKAGLFAIPPVDLKKRGMNHDTHRDLRRLKTCSLTRGIVLDRKTVRSCAQRPDVSPNIIHQKRRKGMTGKTASKNGWLRRSTECLCLVAVLFLVWATAASAAKEGPKEVVARWGKSVITNEDLDLRIKNYPPEIQERLKDPGQRKQYIESLIQILTAGAEARAQKIDKDKEVSVRIADMVNSILLQEYINRKLKNLAPSTEEDVKAFFDAHKDEYVTPVFIHAQHILIEAKPNATEEQVAEARAKAEKVYDEIAAGGDFGNLARQYSDDKETREQGGDLGLFRADQMVPEFSGPVFMMKKDDLGKPFRTPFGFHVVKVNDLIPARQMELNDVKDDVQTRLENEKREKFVYGELERLKKKYKVEIY